MIRAAPPAGAAGEDLHRVFRAPDAERVPVGAPGEDPGRVIRPGRRAATPVDGLGRHAGEEPDFA